MSPPSIDMPSASDAMPHLFRVWSDSSNGINSRTTFAPQAAKTVSTRYVPPIFSPEMGKQLKVAVSGKHTTDHEPNPFVFVTTSLLLALQLAHYRESRSERNIHITCFHAGQVRTPSGARVRFRCVGELLQAGKVAQLDRNKEPRLFPAEYATLGCIVTGDSARTASLQELKDGGLYKLYPTIKMANDIRGSGSRVNMELDLIRGMYFLETSAIRPCGTSGINLAARLAAMFKANGGVGEKVAEHLLAWFLSLQKRDDGDKAVILQWLEKNSFPRTNILEHDPSFKFVIDMTTMPEVLQFHEIWPICRNRTISDRVLLAPAEIPVKHNLEEETEWLAFEDMSRKRHKEMRRASEDTLRGGRRSRGRRDYDKDGRGDDRDDRVAKSRVGRRDNRRGPRRPRR